MKRKRFRWLLRLTFALLFLFCLWIGMQLWMGVVIKGHYFDRAEEAPEAPVILVLGARAYPDRPSMMLKERLDVAIDLYQAKKAPKIIVSGGSKGEEYNEPRIMSQYLVEAGVAKEDIIQDAGGSNSYRSLYRLRHRYGFQKALLATTAYHLPRCLYLGRALGIDVDGVPSPNHAVYGMPYNYLRESLAQWKAWYNVHISAPEVNLQ